MLPIVTGGALAARAATKVVTKIPKGEMGIRTRFGEPVRNKG